MTASSKSSCFGIYASAIEKCVKKNASCVILPECFQTPYKVDSFASFAEDIITGETPNFLQEQAIKHSIYLVGGTFIERDGDFLYNTCTVWNPVGELICKYRKIHLFDVAFENVKFTESSVLTAGKSPAMFSIGQFNIGVGICFDLRFPHLADFYRCAGCNVLVFPGCFTVPTGRLHWELLLRARALDSASFVVAASIARDTNSVFESWGHSMICNPSGQIVQSLDHEEGFLVQELTLNEVNVMRHSIPTFELKRQFCPQ
ncbi:hypothetical protein P9112_007884 [Eukaryota sp. TZLM1-RC]